jgi:hypothetical protein
MSPEPQYFKVLAERALEKLSRAPGTLDSCDLGQLDILGQGDEARAAKAAALAPPPAAAPAVTAAAASAPTITLDAVSAALKSHKSAILQLQDFAKGMQQKNLARNARLDALEHRLAALEARPAGLKYCGVWTDGENYAVGDVTTRSGSMWVSKLAENRSIPGADGGVGWTLAVKHGKDAR